METNGVDCVLLVGAGPSKDPLAEEELLQGLPFLGVSLVGSRGFEYLVDVFFTQDRAARAKGAVEVLR